MLSIRELSQPQREAVIVSWCNKHNKVAGVPVDIVFVPICLHILLYMVGYAVIYFFFILDTVMDEDVKKGLAEAVQCSNALFLSLCLNFLLLAGSWAYFQAGHWRELLRCQSVPELLMHTITSIATVATVGGSDATAKQLIRDLLCAVHCSPGGIPEADFVELVQLEQRARDRANTEVIQSEPILIEHIEL